MAPVKVRDRVLWTDAPARGWPATRGCRQFIRPFGVGLEENVVGGRFLAPLCSLSGGATAQLCMCLMWDMPNGIVGVESFKMEIDELLTNSDAFRVVS